MKSLRIVGQPFHWVILVYMKYVRLSMGQIGSIVKKRMTLRLQLLRQCMIYALSGKKKKDITLVFIPLLLNR